MKRAARTVFWVVTGLATGLLIAVIALYVVSRTSFGHERVRRIALNWLDDRVDGTVHVGAIGGGGLLGGLTLKDFYIIDQRGRPFMKADSARLAYNWRTLLAGEIVVTRAALFRPEIYFEQLPGDSVWNFQHVFPSRGDPNAPKTRRLILLNDVRVVNGTAVVRVPYETPADAQAALEDSRREVIDTVPGGLAKVLRFDSVNSQFSRFLWESPIEDGKLVDIRALTGRGFIWRDPMHVTAMRGTVTLRDTIVAFDIPDARLPSTRASLIGRVIMEEGQNFFDVRVDSRGFAFRDLHWLYPRLPEEGGGSGVLHIQSQRPRGILWLVRDTRITAPGTRVAGNFGVVTGADSLYFTDVDLRASPLNLDLIQAMLPKKLPIDGLLVGTVEVKGGLSALQTSGNIHLTSAGNRSGVKWRGTVDLEKGIGANNFRADLDRLDLAILTALRPDLALRGQVTGRVEASGNIDNSVKFAADIHHYLKGYASSFSGSGTYTGGPNPGLDVELNARPLSLQELAESYPALKWLQGDAHGPIRLTGTLDNLALTADLETLGGRAQLEGQLTRTGETPRYSGKAKLFSFRLDRLVSQLAETTLDGTVAFDIGGSSMASAHGRISAQLDRANVRGIDVAHARMAFGLANGLATVDTLQARTVIGEITGRGQFGLDETATGKLAFEVRSDTIQPVIEDTANHATTAGHVRGSGEITGSVQSFDLRANLAIDAFRYGSIASDRITTSVKGTALGRDNAVIELRGRVDSLVAFGEHADTAAFELDYGGGSGAARLDAGTHNGNKYIIDAGLERRPQGFLLALRDVQVGQRAASWKLASESTIEVDDHGLSIDSLDVRSNSGGLVRAGGKIAWHGTSHALEPGLDSNFRLDFAGVPFSDFALVTAGASNMRGTFDGHMRVRGSPASPIIDGDAAIAGFGMSDATVDRLSASFAYAGAQLNARVEAEKDGRRVLFADGLIPINLAFVPVARRRLAEPLHFNMQADSLPAIFLTSFIDGFSDVRGSLNGNLLATGTTARPQLAGSLALRDAAAQWDVTGVRYRAVDATLRIEQDRVAQLDGTLSANGGTARVKGAIDLARLSNPGFDLAVNARDFLAARRRDADLTVSGDVKLGGHYRQPELTGSIDVERGTLFLDELYRRYQIVELDNPLLYDVVDTSIVALATIVRTQNPFVKNLIVHDLRVDVGRETWLRSRDLNVQVAGELLVAFIIGDPVGGQRTADDLRLTGTLNAQRGTYQLEIPPIARRFNITEGTIEFPGTPGIDPNLGFNAVYRAPRLNGSDPIDIIAVVGGTLRTPRVRLTTDEATQVSESDLTSYLFFGAPTYQLTPNQNAAIAGVKNSLLSGYLAGGLQDVAQSYGLLDYVGLTAEGAQNGPGLSNNTGIASLFAGTRLELGRYANDGRIYIAYSQRLTTTGYKPGVRVEWRLLPKLTAEAFWEDRFARNPGFGIEQSNLKRVWGLFLYREWTY